MTNNCLVYIYIYIYIYMIMYLYIYILSHMLILRIIPSSESDHSQRELVALNLEPYSEVLRIRTSSDILRCYIFTSTT